MDLLCVVRLEKVGIKNSLLYKEILVEISDHQVCKLWMKEVVLVKVLLRNQEIEKNTYDSQESMKPKYPYIFMPIDDNICCKDLLLIMISFL